MSTPRLFSSTEEQIRTKELFSFAHRALHNQIPSVRTRIPSVTMTGVRQPLSLNQKKLILEEFKQKKRAGVKITQAALAAWAKETFRLDLLPDQSTISRI